MPQLTVNRKNSNQKYGNKNEQVVCQAKGNMVSKPVKPVVGEQKSDWQSNKTGKGNQLKDFFWKKQYQFFRSGTQYFPDSNLFCPEDSGEGQ